MKLRNFVLAAALGTCVIAAVPAVVHPIAAHADDCDNNTQSCTPDGGGDDAPPPPSAGGGGTENAQAGNVGDTLPDVPVITIVGKAPEPQFPQPVLPVDPGITPTSGAGGGVPTGAVRGKTLVAPYYMPGECFTNNNGAPFTLTQNFTYTVSYQVSANATASVLSVLSGTLGVQVNTTITKSYTMQATLAAGQTFALNVQYEIVQYLVTTPSSMELVNVLEPTGNVMVGTCG